MQGRPLSLSRGAQAALDAKRRRQRERFERISRQRDTARSARSPRYAAIAAVERAATRGGTPPRGKERARLSREQTKQRITELFVRGDTQGNAPGTKWAAVNATIEHPDWGRPRALQSAVCSGCRRRSPQDPCA
jgi:hypothetical protein